MSSFKAQYFIYAYLYFSGALLIYNVLYMLWHRWRATFHERQARRWVKRLRKALKTYWPEDSFRLRRYRASLRRKLGSLRALMAFTTALERMEEEEPEKIRLWLDGEEQLFQLLAGDYRKRESMERAYYAWFLARFHLIQPHHGNMINILFDYLEDSSIYCRENVLRALYSCGNARAVEKAYQYFNDYGVFHNKKLLADGLLTFSGDRYELAHILWPHAQWSAEQRCAVVQFIMRLTPVADFSEPFLAVLKDRTANLELRLAIIRYFGSFYSEKAHALLLGYAREEALLEMAIVSAFALRNYPGDETVAALLQAISSRNWYVRANAASSLIALDAKDAMQAVLEGKDPYARDMLLYQKSRQIS